LSVAAGEIAPAAISAKFYAVSMPTGTNGGIRAPAIRRRRTAFRAAGIAPAITSKDRLGNAASAMPANRAA
jgi:hypothetical protein